MNNQNLSTASFLRALPLQDREQKHFPGLTRVLDAGNENAFSQKSHAAIRFITYGMEQVYQKHPGETP